MGEDLAVRSSLPLQILLYLNQWYDLFWVLIEALVFVFKGQTLPFATSVLAGEIILFIVLFFLDLFRIYFASKGNLTERNIGIVISLVIALPCIAGIYLEWQNTINKNQRLIIFVLSNKGYVYLLVLQHYVLRVELIINAIQLGLMALEILLEIIAMIVFARANS